MTDLSRERMDEYPSDLQARRAFAHLMEPSPCLLAELWKVFPAPIDVDLQDDKALAEMVRAAAILALRECA
jgi:hypothetical protein